MKQIVDTMPTVGSIDSASVFGSDLLDDIAKVTIQRTGLGYCYRRIKRFSGGADQSSVYIEKHKQVK
jgi:hypothetical protein